MGPGGMNDDVNGPQDNGPEHDPRRPALIGLAVVLLLVVVSYFLVTALRRNSDLEDCLDRKSVV